MFNEEVETSFLYFIVEDTGKDQCLVFVSSINEKTISIRNLS